MKVENGFQRDLREAVAKLAELRSQKEKLQREIEVVERSIHDLAVEKLHVIEKPHKWHPKQFVCGGKVVQVARGDDVMESPRIHLYEIGSLPTM